jgi:translation initiation factor IF-1
MSCFWFNMTMYNYYKFSPAPTFQTTVTYFKKKTEKTSEWKGSEQIVEEHWWGNSIKYKNVLVEKETITGYTVTCELTPQIKAFFDRVIPVLHAEDKKECKLSSRIRGKMKQLENLKKGDTVIVEPIAIEGSSWTVSWRLAMPTH